MSLSYFSLNLDGMGLPLWPRGRDDLAAPLRETHLAAVGLQPEPDARLLARLRVDDRDLRDVQRRLFVDDAAGLARPTRLLVALDDVETLDVQAVVLGQDLAHAPGLAAVFPAQHDDGVAGADF